MDSARLRDVGSSAAHPKYEVYYEDLAADPDGVANRIARFLGLSDHDGYEVRHRRTGGDKLQDAIVNYHALKVVLQRWAGFAED